MNRQGQPQQRPPNLAPNPALASQFRSPFSYGLPPPRNVNVLQAGGFIPGMQPSNHRTPAQQSQSPAQSMVPQPTPTYMQQQQQQQRGAQSGFGFGGGIGGGAGGAGGQQHQPTPTGLQQPQPNGTSSTLPPHLSQTPSLGNAPSVSSTSELGLDPNDFPALGSTSTNNNNGSGGTNGGSIGSSVTTSYASQAGTGVVGLAGGAGTGTGAGAGSSSAIGGGAGAGSSQPRDFTPDDFPALGGGQSQSQSNQETSHSHSHPPGLNGFEQQHRQGLLGTLGGGALQQTPGMLNLGPQGRSGHLGFETEKQQRNNNYALKLNQSAHAAWSSPNANPSAQSQPGTAGVINLGLGGTGAFSNSPSTQQQQQNGTHLTQQQNPTSTHIIGSGANNGNGNNGASTNAPNPSGYTSNGLVDTSVGPIANSNPNPNSNPTNPTPNPHHTNANSTQNPNSMPNSTAHVHQHPQTPAQQILMSAADRWGLLGLLAMIKNAGADVDQGLSSVGTDLGTMGLDMGYAGNLYSTFITPWADQSAAHTVEPDFHLPACYSVQPPPPGPSKAQAFSDETLFFMFYSTPRDALQEVAAQELWNRNWRFHKELRLWITKDSGAAPSQKVIGGESGQYTYWDPENWLKERKDMTVLYADLEEKTVPAFMPGPGLISAPQTTTGQQGLPGMQSGQQGQMGTTQRGSFQMGVAV